MRYLKKEWSKMYFASFVICKTAKSVLNFNLHIFSKDFMIFVAPRKLNVMS